MTHMIVVDMVPNRQNLQNPARDATVIHLTAAPALYTQDPHNGHPQESATMTETPGADAESLAPTSEAATVGKEDVASIATLAVGALTRTESHKIGVP